MTDLHYMMLQDVEKEIRALHRDVRIDRRIYSYDGDYQPFMARHWGSGVTINFLPAGIHVFVTGKPETDRLFPYEDATSIESTIAHISSLLKIRFYKWQK